MGDENIRSDGVAAAFNVKVNLLIGKMDAGSRSNFNMHCLEDRAPVRYRRMDIGFHSTKIGELVLELVRLLARLRYLNPRT